MNANNVGLNEIKALRVRYSAVVNNVSMFYRVIMAFIFSIIILRKLPVEEYGLFAVIAAYVSLLQSVPGIWTWWVQRFYARKKMDIVSVGFTLTIVYGFISSIIIFCLSTFYIKYDVNNTLLLSAVVTINFSLLIIYAYIGSILSVSRPYLIGYNVIIGESIRVITAYYMIVVYKYGLMGLFTALISRNIVLVILGIYQASKYKIIFPYPTVKKEQILLLFRNSYISALNVIYNQIKNSSERLIVNILTGSLILPAYLNVSYIPRNFLLGSASAFSSSLSSRLLRGPSKTDIEDILRIVFILYSFIVGLFIIYSKTILSLFRSEYVNVHILFSLYCIVFLLDSLRYLFGTISTSLERSDLHLSGLRLSRTVLLKNPLTNLLGNIVQIIIATSIFYIELKLGISDPLTLLLPFPITAIMVYFPIVIIFYKRSMEKINYTIPIKEVLASIAGIFGMFLIAYSTGYNNFIIHTFTRDLLFFIYIISLSSVAYFVIVLICSQWFRKFIYKGLEVIIKETIRSNDIQANDR